MRRDLLTDVLRDFPGQPELSLGSLPSLEHMTCCYKKKAWRKGHFDFTGTLAFRNGKKDPGNTNVGLTGTFPCILVVLCLLASRTALQSLCKSILEYSTLSLQSAEHSRSLWCCWYYPHFTTNGFIGRTIWSSAVQMRVCLPCTCSVIQPLPARWSHIRALPKQGDDRTEHISPSNAGYKHLLWMYKSQFIFKTETMSKTRS